MICHVHGHPWAGHAIRPRRVDNQVATVGEDIYADGPLRPRKKPARKRKDPDGRKPEVSHGRE